MTSSKRAHRHPPRDWEHARESENGWLCRQIDGHLSAFGVTREEAVAEAWRVHHLPDLHRIAAGLCRRELGTPGRRRGVGLAIVTVHRTRPPDAEPGWWGSIDALFGADFDVIKGIAEQAKDGDFGFFDELPEGDILEVLCRVVRESDEHDEYGRMTYRGHDYLEIVDLHGTPAVSVIFKAGALPAA